MREPHSEVTSGTYCWILQRMDGVGFGATSCDRPQRVGAMTFEPDVDLRPTQLTLTDRMFGSGLDLEGGLTSTALNRNDLLTGRWNEASVQLLAGNWSQDSDLEPICTGVLGQVRAEDGSLAMTLDVLPQALREPPCIQTSPECRAILGDAQCRIDMRSRRKRVRVIAVDEFTCTIDLEDARSFAMGRLRWITGPNCGIEHVIIKATGSELSLQNATGLTIQAGDVAILHEGCDGRRATCSSRFANIENFRGEPDLPGSEILLRYPGA